MKETASNALGDLAAEYDVLKEQVVISTSLLQKGNAADIRNFGGLEMLIAVQRELYEDLVALAYLISSMRSIYARYPDVEIKDVHAAATDAMCDAKFFDVLWNERVADIRENRLQPTPIGRQIPVHSMFQRVRAMACKFLTEEID